MSDTYNYEEGAIHNDHKKVLHIGNVGSNDIGKLINAFFTDNAEEAETMEEVNTPAERPSKSTSIPASRSAIIDQLLALADKGEWANGHTADDVKTMLKKILGDDGISLVGKEAELSERLWRLLERGRGDRVKIVWQNLLGYFIDRRLLSQTVGAPALNKMFFGDDNGYTNIDKGRPSKGLLTSDFKSLLPLLDAYLPKA